MLLEVARDSVRPGESWARAADRAASDASAGSGRISGPVLAVDLSSDPLLFRTAPETRIAVRAMTEGDQGDVSRWVAAPHVARWWREHRRSEDVRYWIWEVNGRSVGFCQDYRIADHPGYALLCGRPDAVGFDYAVGEAARVGRGLGTALLWVFLRDIVVPSYDGVSEVFAAPDHRNAASRRVLAKLGATEGLWFDEPRAGGVDTVVGCSIDVGRVLRG